MKPFAFVVAAAVFAGITVLADPAPKGALNDTRDLFAVVTPDRLLGNMTRRKWLSLWPIPGKEYWAAWDCKDKPCDTPQRVHERATAKLISRTDRDPKPLTDTSAGANP